MKCAAKYVGQALCRRAASCPLGCVRAMPRSPVPPAIDRCRQHQAGEGPGASAVVPFLQCRGASDRPGSTFPGRRAKHSRLLVMRLSAPIQTAVPSRTAQITVICGRAPSSGRRSCACPSRPAAFSPGHRSTAHACNAGRRRTHRPRRHPAARRHTCARRHRRDGQPSAPGDLPVPARGQAGRHRHPRQPQARQSRSSSARGRPSFPCHPWHDRGAHHRRASSGRRSLRPGYPARLASRPAARGSAGPAGFAAASTAGRRALHPAPLRASCASLAMDALRVPRGAVQPTAGSPALDLAIAAVGAPRAAASGKLQLRVLATMHRVFVLADALHHHAAIFASSSPEIWRMRFVSCFLASARCGCMAVNLS